MPGEIKGPKQYLILRNNQSPGDILMLTAAVRDLHQSYPGRFVVDVRTPYPEIWKQNPHITPLKETARNVSVVDCHYPLIHASNEKPFHFIHGFTHFLNDTLGIHIVPSVFRGDVHISAREKGWMSQVEEIFGMDIPFWIVAAGGKHDVTIKWWEQERYQKVVDHFRGRVLFVQVGELTDYHPPLRGVLDLRGKTDLRQLIRLMYHAQGVLCPVTMLMHLAAAVETKNPNVPLRPCVVVAGGRESVHWEEYPGHQFLHTIGALECCASGGCWKARTRPLGDGDEGDDPDQMCVNVRGNLPRCMDMITAELVTERIEMYLAGGTCRILNRMERQRVDELVHWGQPETVRNWAIVSERFKTDARPINGGKPEIDLLSARFGFAADNPPPFPRQCQGRGIVMAGGGAKYLVNAWVCVRMLRWLGCKLPIELWHIGTAELPEPIRELLQPFGVRFRDAERESECRPIRILNGWTLKAFAIVHSSFAEVLFIDSDNMPVKNPEYLFDDPRFRATGAIFWPDYGRLSPFNPVWKLLGLRYGPAREFESGQILVHKRICWQSLNLALWLNNFPDILFNLVLGDKETFHLAFIKTGQPYLMPRSDIVPLDYQCMCQHDLDGARIFQHRNGNKWQLFSDNPPLKGFVHERLCRRFLAEWQTNATLRRALRNAVVPEHQQSVASILARKKSLPLDFAKGGSGEWRMTLHVDGIVSSSGNNGSIVFLGAECDGLQNKLLLFDWEGMVASLQFNLKTLRWEGAFRDGCETPCVANERKRTPSGAGGRRPGIQDRRWFLRYLNGEVRLFEMLPNGCVVGLAGQGIGFWERRVVQGKMLLRMERSFGEFLSFDWKRDQKWVECVEDKSYSLMSTSKVAFSEGPAKPRKQPRPNAIPFQVWFDGKAHHDWSRALRETPRYHRLQWEYTSLLHVLRSRGVLSEGMRGACIFSKNEPITALIAAHCRAVDVVALNIPPGKDDGDTGQGCALDELKIALNDRGLCPSERFWNRVTVTQADSLQEPGRTRKGVNFLYGIGALDLLLTRADPEATLSEWLGLMRPTGIAVFSGDYCLSKSVDTKGGDNANTATHSRLLSLKRRLGKQGWRVTIPTGSKHRQSNLDACLDREPYSSDMHYRFQRSNAIFTSTMIVISK